MASTSCWRLVPAALACAAFLFGCAGESGKDGQSGASSIVQLTPEAAGANCALGGTRIQSGLDANRNGVLDPAEVAATQYVCNGPAGPAGHDSLLATAPEDAGANCPSGGTRIQSGLDADDDGTLDAGEVSSTQYVCNGAAGANGHTTLVATAVEPPGTNCATGGIRVQSGVDANGSATLDAAEVVFTQSVCNGAAGEDGQISLVTTAAEAAGANCEHGGTRLDSGLDADRDGALDAAEVTATRYVCNGAPGANGLTALVSATAEAAGATCAAGGTRIDAGLDADADGTLDAAEIAATRYVCNGADGADGHASLVATARELPGATCAAGGVRVQSGLDADGDGVLDPAEVSSIQYVCDGAAGANGLAALVSAIPEAAGTNCAAGGTRVDSGLDADADGVLDAGEIAATRYVCDGAAGSNGTDGLNSLVATSPEAPGASCAAGGVRVQSGLDADGDAVLDAAEVSSTQYVCNGADGADGRAALLALSPEGAGANCPHGGTRVQSGVDADGDGTLDPAEVSSTQYVCDGADGANGVTALVATAPLAPGGACADGGTRVQAGLDADRDGTLDPAEVASTHDVCNGAPGADGANGALVVTSPEPAGTSCANGGIRVESGVDADGSGFLEPAEIALTQYVCDGADGAPGATSLVTTAQEPAGPNCQYGGTRIDAGLDTNGNGTLELDEATSTQYACNGGAGPAAVLGMSPEPAGPNCAHGGTRVDTGLDANGNGVLDPDEVSATQYLCNPDTSHPYVVSVSPGAGNVAPDAAFCVTFSEAIDPASIDGASLTLARSDDAEVAATLAYDPAGPTACLAPVFPLDLFGAYTLVATSGIRDLAGNGLLPRFTQAYLVAPPLPPNLRVRIDSVAVGPGTVDVAYTVSNADAGAAGAFTVGFFVDPPFPPGVGAMPDASDDVAGLPGFSSASGTIAIPAGGVSALYAYVDVTGAVAESAEWDNLGGVSPALTGPIVATPTAVEELAELTVTAPVNAVTRCADVFLGADASSGGGAFTLGTMCGNAAGEGTISGTFLVPPGLSALGTASVWINLWDAWGWTAPAQYLAYLTVSPVNLSRFDAGAWVDSGLPLTVVTVAAPTRPNLTLTIDAVTPGPGTLDVAYTVRNDGFGDAGPFTVGIFVDPMATPVVGSLPDGTDDVAGVPVGASASGVVTVAAGASSAVVGLVDAAGAVPETDEDDNVGLMAATMTASPTVAPSVAERYGAVTVTVPVGFAARYVEVYVGGDYASGPGWWLGSAPGNFAGEGEISATFPVADWIQLGDWTLWVRVSGGPWTAERLYVPRGDVAPGSYTILDSTWTVLGDSGIPLTPISVVAPTSPNLTVAIDAVTPGAGTVDVAYTVRNVGYGDAGPFTVGLFVDPATPPGVGSLPDGADDLAGLAAGGTASGTVTLTAGAGATVLAYVDVGGAVSETNETDNLGRLPPSMTGAPIVTPTTVEAAGALTVTVPVNASARTVELSLGGEWGGGSTWLGSAWGNDAGEGAITATVTVPEWTTTGEWTLWLRVTDAAWMSQRLYAPVAWISTESYALVDPTTGTVLGDSGIPTARVTVVAPTSPNLTMTIDSVTPGAGTVDVAYTVRNTGYGDAGPFTVGFFVNPPVPPAVGSVADATADLAGLALGASTGGTITLTGDAWAAVFGYVDLDGAVSESNETDNLGRLAAAMTGSPVVTPATVEATGAVTVTVPVNASARNVELLLGGEWGGPTWHLGNAWGNQEGQGEITGTFTVPADAPLGLSTIWVRVADDGWGTQSYYVPVSFVSTTTYAVVDGMTGTVLGDSGIPMSELDVLAPTSPNLVVRINSVVEGAGTVDVAFTVRNIGYSAAGPSTVGLFVDPAVEPGVGATPDVTWEVGALAVGAAATATVTLGGSAQSDLVAYADVAGAVAETNELDNLARPRPTLVGPIVATPATVDEGTLLTLTVPVNRTTHNVDVYVGDQVGGPSLSLGQLWGNYDGEGFIAGTVPVPPGASSWGTVSVWLILWDEMHTVGVEYAANAAVSAVSYARAVVTAPTPTWTDSGIPLAFVTIVPATRPNLQATIDQIVPGPGTVDVTYTVRNVGAGDAGPFSMGFFADPAAVPGPGSIPDAAEDVLSLAVGASYTSTVTLAAGSSAAVFAYADLAEAVDEQSETDNAAWVIPVPAITGQPSVSTGTVPVGGTVDVTVAVSSSVRQIDVYVGGLASDSPAFLIGSATGNAAGEGVIQATCTAPPGSAGDWYVWIATHDAWGLTWRGYLSYGPVSTTYYTEYDPGQDGPPAVPTSIPLTALTVTDAM